MAAKSPLKMTYNFLGRSGLRVSSLCLGGGMFGENTMAYSGSTNEQTSMDILNRFAELGGNFIDTSNVYGYGASEKIIGKWLSTQPRHQFIIATKCGVKLARGPAINNGGTSRRHILESIEQSLANLQTDFVDLYQMHNWDSGTPLEETLGTLDELVRSGKIRYFGVNNFSGWQMQKAVDLTAKLGLAPIVSLQQQYNLLCRESELEPFQVCKNEGVGILAYSPLRGGLLNGKLKRGQNFSNEGRIGWSVTGPGVRMGASPFQESDITDETFDVIEAAEDIAKDVGRTVPQVAVRWLLKKELVSSIILGVRSVAQLEGIITDLADWSLSETQMSRLDEVSAPKLDYLYNLISLVNKNRRNPFC